MHRVISLVLMPVSRLAVFQLIGFMASFVVFSTGLRAIMSSSLEAIGWSAISVLRMGAEMEPGVQALSVLLSFRLMSLLSRRLRSAFPLSLPKLHWLSIGGLRRGFFKGFLAASFLIALSLFLGVFEIERPQISALHLSWIAPWLLLQVLLLALWVFALEFMRENLFWRFLCQRLGLGMSLLLYVFFEAYLFYLLASSLQVNLSTSALWGFATLLSLALNLSYQSSLRTTLSVRELFNERCVAALSFLSFAIHIYGVGISGWRGASVFQLYGQQGDYSFYILLALFCVWIANTAFQSLLFGRSLRA